jgi:hypothetical protein
MYNNSLSSNNQTRAGNQQERLIKIGWIIGFVDGEGCFSIGFTKQPDREHRKGYNTGYQVSHEFVVTQGVKSLSALEDLKDFFKVGQLIINRRNDNHKENLFRYVVRKRKDIIDVIIPFFQQYPLQTSKKVDFDKFVQCMRYIELNAHLEIEGLIKIALITEQMNHQKSRRQMIKILRDYTSDLRPPAEEDIVPTAWRHAGL